MKHKPFEDWIFQEEIPEKEDQKSLYNHLRDCDECYLLEKNWRQIEHLLVAAPISGPANGFTERWQARLTLDRQRVNRRQNFAMLAATTVSAGMFLILFIMQFYRQIAGAIAPLALWMTSASAIVGTALEPIGDTFRLVMDLTPAPFTMLLVMAFFAGTGTIAILWLKMFRALARVQGMQQWA